jgi:uncharacterized protein (DUF433 family)
VRHGKPIIKDTRVPVEIILGSLAGGMEIDEINKYRRKNVTQSFYEGNLL